MFPKDTRCSMNGTYANEEQEPPTGFAQAPHDKCSVTELRSRLFASFRTLVSVTPFVHFHAADRSIGDLLYVHTPISFSCKT